MDDLEKEMRECFLQEADQLLEEAEVHFLALEQGGDASTVDHLFRLAHNLKGSSRAVGFSDMSDFTHKLESLLLKIKNKEISTNTDVVNLLLESNDHVKRWVQELKSNDSAKVDSSELAARLLAGIQGELEGAKAPVSAPEVEEEIKPEEIVALSEENPESPGVVQSTESSWQLDEAELNKFVTAEPAKIEDELNRKASDILFAESVAKATTTEEPKKSTPAAGAPPAPKTEDESLRVSLSRLDSLINNVGELVILQTVLNQHKVQVASPLLQSTITQLGKITKDIQDISMSLRMIPFKATFQKMQRIVRDVSKSLGKEVTMKTEGEHTEVDKTVVDLLGDPLVHLIRNAVDHGIESQEERIKNGKPANGTVILSATHKGGQIVIEIRDDGKGLNAEVLRRKAIEKGIIKESQILTPSQCHELIFAPGFSTKAEVTEFSGRGVGMDVVKTNIEKKLNGEIELETEMGKGTCVRIRLPLTLAIIDGMVVCAAEDRYVVPLSQVFETLQPREQDLHKVTGLGEVLSLRGEQLPVTRLTTIFSKKPSANRQNGDIAIVVRSGEEPFALLVDDILGQQQIVIKQLGAEIRNLKGVSGGAILGDGHAALILDLNELVKSKAGKPNNQTLRGVA